MNYYHTTNQERIDNYLFKMVNKPVLRELTPDYFEWMLNNYQLRTDNYVYDNDIYIDFTQENLDRRGYYIRLSNVEFKGKNFCLDNAIINILIESTPIFKPVHLNKKNNYNFISIIEKFLENHGAK
jgi:hypothetical protein